jgi:hypothetical protein
MAPQPAGINALLVHLVAHHGAALEAGRPIPKGETLIRLFADSPVGLVDFRSGDCQER